jgi:hypothetical protein
MAKKLRLTVRVLEQSVSVIALGLFALTLVGVRWFAGGAAMGLGLAVGAGVACVIIVAAMIYMHYASPRRVAGRGSEPRSC